MRNSAEVIPEMLAEGIRFLIYAGMLILSYTVSDIRVYADILG